MEIEKIKKLMLRSFKEGQKTPDASKDTIKLWIATELI